MRRFSCSEVAVVLPDALGATQRELNELAIALVLPDSTFILETELATAASGRNQVILTYLAPDTLGAQARSMAERQVEAVLGLPEVEVEFRALPSLPREIAGPDDSLVEEVAALTERLPRAGVVVLTPGLDDEQADQLRTALIGAGVPADRIDLQSAEGPLRLQLIGPLQPETLPD